MKVEKRWQCQACLSIHESHFSAVQCCEPYEIEVCAACGERVFDDEDPDTHECVPADSGESQ